MTVPSPLLVVAAAVIHEGRLLVVSKKAAPAIFYLPGGKPEPAETAEQTLARELAEELGVAPVDARLLGHVRAVAAIERVPMLMTVFAAGLSGEPTPSAEISALAWTTGDDAHAPSLAPALTWHVIPMLRSTGALAESAVAGQYGERGRYPHWPGW